MAYFLELDANPNKANDFGKTPLMYAAQRNALVAAEMLLDAGANPNATTGWPVDTCYYSLETATMTPLHYAVRYGSAELVNLLLDRGAATYIRTTRSGGLELDAPLDWLRRYTASNAPERNPNIAEDEVEALAERLALPTPENRAALATRLAIDAEARYTSGDVRTAYDILRRALLADATNTRALSDMSLIALRANEPSEAAGAAEALISLNESPRMTANAWFNFGLACSGPDARSRVRYEARYPCLWGGAVPIYPFLQAWLSEPTTARAEKLRELFATRVTCTRSGDDSPIESYVFGDGAIPGRGYRYRVYAYHAAAVELAADAIAQDTISSRTAGGLAIVERHELGDRAITVYEAQTSGIPQVANLVCQP